MKQDSIIIRQHTHARDKGQQSQQNTLHKNRQYNTSIYNNLNAKTYQTRLQHLVLTSVETSTKISVPILHGSKKAVLKAVKA
jgi:hypothetical protein